MKTLIELALRLFDLIEAEGRQARYLAVQLFAAMLLLCVATALILTAVVTLLAALFLVLAPYTGAAGALALVALLPLLAGVAGVFIGRAVLPQQTERHEER